MRIFVTGATGWIGSAVVDELLGAGHEVTGLARSDTSAAKLERKGARVRRGDLDDLGAVRAGTAEAEAVVHLANKHDWADPAATNRAERGAVATMLEALTGSGRPILVANGLSGLVRGRPATEADPSPEVGPESDRGGSENLTLDHAEHGVRSMVVRFAPSVHGTGDWGFVSLLTAAARRRGVSAYVGEGANAWSAVHRSDAARLVRLALERAPAGSRLHAVAEEAVSTRRIAEAVGSTLGLPVVSIAPESAEEHFGIVGGFFGMDMSASGARTRDLLSWTPTGPALLQDIRSGAYA
ncbi:SDR family oxidoreductase [Streptosporangium sp. NPDC001559]|uniref:SDR family oxidoreductase n=1 Tax=Streptosporangium sp. NPDC001559 TaxID=3366187 RepID=UPI0036F17D9D